MLCRFCLLISTPVSAGQFHSNTSPETSALHSEQELGAAAMALLSLLHHPSQSRLSGVSSWVVEQNSKIRQNMLTGTVLLSRDLAGLCAFNDNFFSHGTKLGRSSHESSAIPSFLTELFFDMA